MGDDCTSRTAELRAGALAVFLVFALLMFPAHETAHYMTYRALGIHLQMTLNTASPSDRALRRPIAELAGPLFNLGVAAISAVLFLKTSARGGNGSCRWPRVSCVSISTH
jgi:hypothetical protein